MAALVQTIRRRGRLLSTTIAQVSKQLAAHDASRDGTISVQDFVRTLGQFNFGIHPSSLQVIVNGILTDEPNRVGYQTFVSEIKRISSVAAHAPDKFQKLQNEALRRSGLELSTGNNGGNSGDGKNSESRYERMMAVSLQNLFLYHPSFNISNYLDAKLNKRMNGLSFCETEEVAEEVAEEKAEEEAEEEAEEVFNEAEED